MKIVAMSLGVFLFVLSFGLAVHYNQKALNFRADIERERYARLVAEENGENAHAQIRHLKAELAKVQKKMADVQRSLEQSQLAHADWQAQREEEMVIRGSLEKKIKELEGAIAGDVKQEEVRLTDAAVP
jgi:chromosome segregation ATPase